MRRFVNDDAGYVTWFAGHPHGYVLNTVGVGNPDLIMRRGRGTRG